MAATTPPYLDPNLRGQQCRDACKTAMRIDRRNEPLSKATTATVPAGQSQCVGLAGLEPAASSLSGIEAKRCAELASAFQDDPVIAWIFPDEQRRRGVLPAFKEFRLRKLAYPHDEVSMTAGGAAAAVWFPPPGRWQLSRRQRLRLLPPLVRFRGLRTASVLGGLDRMEARHPHDPPHWYLFILGTEQAAQGRGWARPCWLGCWLASMPTGCLLIWSRRTSGTSPCTAAMASRSPAR